MVRLVSRRKSLSAETGSPGRALPVEFRTSEQSWPQIRAVIIAWPGDTVNLKPARQHISSSTLGLHAEKMRPKGRALSQQVCRESVGGCSCLMITAPRLQCPPGHSDDVWFRIVETCTTTIASASIFHGAACIRNEVDERLSLDSLVGRTIHFPSDRGHEDSSGRQRTAEA
ncbi:hypothetical protein BV25DRAFT_1500644 [Artomyces pyxidatus]|uniref:Uncharacterized protein n=1 Tax=Artomyces pyxidatus TaxID=48021 RepID=A0ACB8TBB9_9AGAM|nr:hypothetical protein BV25DRAFT_1500644 [Artomyces pyxidatus]